MENLNVLVQDLNGLIEAGQTIEAMERFYADAVTMQENQGRLRVGKVVCLAHEKQMLEDVSSFKGVLLNQAINELNGVVFSEWQYDFLIKSGEKQRLIEVSVQQWRNGQIQTEKFYYNKILAVL
jgi:hypothetical protein